mmetsp:Transcript_98261/g.305595  ORF Transcript_98261/g.305595 Transcript_98261/m.305595 type:complete len:566 (+) Transcript_98261:46-1743(+)
MVQDSTLGANSDSLAQKLGDAGGQASAHLSLLLRQQFSLAGSGGLDASGGASPPAREAASEELAKVGAAVAAARLAAPVLRAPEAAQRSGSLVVGPLAPPRLATRTSGRTTAAQAANAQACYTMEAGAVAAHRGSVGRYEPWLCGAQLLPLDVGAPENWSAVLDAVAKRQPVLMRLEGGGVAAGGTAIRGDEHRALLLPSAGKWDTSYLQEHMGTWGGCHVMRALDARKRYLYYFDEQPGRDMSACMGVAREASEDLSMSFSDFLHAAREGADSESGLLYLQTPLFERRAPAGPGDPGGVSLCPGMDRAMLADWRELDDERLCALQREGSLGQWSRSQLFVGPSGTLSPCHYDQYDNLFLQLRGAKHVLLFDPWAAEGLYPYPTHHPYDQYARVDLEAVDEVAFPHARTALAGRGAVARVGEGEVLYIPSHWWHHVCGEASDAGAGSAAMSISLSFWFDSLSVLSAPPLPLPDHLELELARHIEFFACDTAGPTAVRALAEALAGDVGLVVPTQESSVPLEPRDFVLLRLLDLLGPAQAVAFVRAFFAPERFASPVRSNAAASTS